MVHLLLVVLLLSVARQMAAGTVDVPTPLPDHPGNIFLEGEAVGIRPSESLPAAATQWRVLDDRQRTIRTGTLPTEADAEKNRLEVGRLGIGWYRVEFGTADEPVQAWTTLAVLGRLRAPVPADTPIAVDSAAAWFARGDVERQKRLANLAALAGVKWVRDRLRWRDVQPTAGPLVEDSTTYDTAAEAQHAAGLEVLQVFHDTPLWAREGAGTGSRFAPDLRRAYEIGKALALRFRGRVAAWEPWNEANVATFGGHTVDQMCSWQKAAYLGFKAGDPAVIVGWNATAAVPTPAHTEGLLANGTWPYFDTYNIHTYDWSHSYTGLWGPAREAACGRPLWITEADRGTPHMKKAPWFDQDPRLERLKAEWMAQAYASSLFAGAQRHFHFILGHYHEPNGVQFGLLRLDLTPRPAYAALAAAGRCLAGARVLGRWEPGQEVRVYAFRARPDGRERDMLVVWAEREVDWDGRGKTTADWTLPPQLKVESIVDYLGRDCGTHWPRPLTSAPVFVFLKAGEAATLPLVRPPALSQPKAGAPSPVVLQLMLPRSNVRRVEDLPWSEGYAYETKPGQSLDLPIVVYNFATNRVSGRLRIVRQPEDWQVELAADSFSIEPMSRAELTGKLRMSEGTRTRDGWVVLRADCGGEGEPALAFRVLARP